MFQAIFSSLCC